LFLGAAAADAKQQEDQQRVDTGASIHPLLLH
jgi:hypothetical protein